MLISLLALVAASLFTGAALYITIAEHPARSTLDDAAMLRQWKPSYAAAAPMQAGLAAGSGLLSLWAAVLERDPAWILPAALMLLIIPYTLIIVMPVNRRLKEIGEARAGPQSRELLRRWGKLHAVRTALGAGAVALMIYAILR